MSTQKKKKETHNSNSSGVAIVSPLSAYSPTLMHAVSDLISSIDEDLKDGKTPKEISQPFPIFTLRKIPTEAIT